MTAEAFAVVVSILSIVVTIVLHKREQQSQQQWEERQVEDRKAWELTLQNHQNAWQKRQDEELKVWQEGLTRPRLKVLTEYGISADAPDATYIFSTAHNTGTVPVYVRKWGQIILPDDKIMDMPPISSDRCGLRGDASNPINSGDSLVAYWRLDYLRSQLEKNGYNLEELEFQTRWTDKIGGKFSSGKIPLLSGQS